MVKKKIKTKTRSLFFRDEGVVSEKKKLAALKRQRSFLIKEIREIIEAYNDKYLNMDDTSEWLNKLPLQSLEDLYQFLSGSKDDYSLTVLELRSRLRKDHSEKVEETMKLEKKIYISQIDLLLAKIGCIQSKLDKNIDRSSHDGYFK
jgi:hypothetical protein